MENVLNVLWNYGKIAFFSTLLISGGGLYSIQNLGAILLLCNFLFLFLEIILYFNYKKVNCQCPKVQGVKAVLENVQNNAFSIIDFP